MSNDKKTRVISYKISELEYDQLCEEAKKAKYIFKKGKKKLQVNLSLFSREKMLSNKVKIIKLDGLDELKEEILKIRNIGKDISYLSYLIKKDNYHRTDNPQIYEEKIKETLEYCQKVIDKQDRIFEALIKVNKHQLELKDNHGIL